MISSSNSDRVSSIFYSTIRTQTIDFANLSEYDMRTCRLSEIKSGSPTSPKDIYTMSQTSSADKPSAQVITDNDTSAPTQFKPLLSELSTDTIDLFAFTSNHDPISLKPYRVPCLLEIKYLAIKANWELAALK